ncbi:MAG: hypothetical protein KDB00_05950 [Planctomycetales bacterium]|nr:hypothetical protein [Planctomycetales bacterium]
MGFLVSLLGVITIVAFIVLKVIEWLVPFEHWRNLRAERQRAKRDSGNVDWSHALLHPHFQDELMLLRNEIDVPKTRRP